MLLKPNFLLSVLKIAEQAGEYLNHFYARKLQIRKKLDNTPVTEADLFISQFLIQKLSNLTPKIPILSEESSYISLKEREGWKTYWLIDPLDGTQQFINRTGQFAVMISLIQDHRPVLGIIHCPIQQLTYYAIQGQGSYKQSNLKLIKLSPHFIDFERPIRIAVGSTKAEHKVRLILNPNYSYDFHICGSSGLKGCLVAEGVVDCYVRIGETGEWDTAAAEIILTEIGGGIFDSHFQPLTYNQRNSLINPDFVMVGYSQLDWRKIFQFNL